MKMLLGTQQLSSSVMDQRMPMGLVLMSDENPTMEDLQAIS